MKILVIGSGGREHALAWKCAQDSQVSRVYLAPGNAGTALEDKLENIAIAADDYPALLDFARREAIDLTLVGPEAPLVDGIVDRFRAAGLPIFGPGAAAAQLEGSKTFTKEFLERHQIPTAAYQSFTDLDAALNYLAGHPLPVVIKADGLAAGKGVVVADTAEQAQAAVRDMLAGNAFGEAGHRVVIEEFLEGEEASFIVIAAGEDCLPMATSQDHKRAHDGDSGPNTGGMGAYSPAPVVTAEVEARIMQEIIRPTLHGMAAEGIPYTGFLYAGLMISPAGEPKVIEYNCRFGDPETQPIMLRLQSSLVELCLSALNGELAQQQARWDPRPALGVVIAAPGYPGNYPKHLPLSLPKSQPADTHIFHAGTAFKEHELVSTGGRIMCATALGDSLQAAQESAYQLCEHIEGPQIWYRRDIGWRALQK